MLIVSCGEGACGLSAPGVRGIQWTVREPAGCLARQGLFPSHLCPQHTRLTICSLSGRSLCARLVRVVIIILHYCYYVHIIMSIGEMDNLSLRVHTTYQGHRACKQQALSAIPGLTYLQPEPNPELPVTAMASHWPPCPRSCLSNSAPMYIHTGAEAAFLKANPTVSLLCKCLQQQFSQFSNRRIDRPSCKKCRCPARHLPF